MTRINTKTAAVVAFGLGAIIPSASLAGPGAMEPTNTTARRINTGEVKMTCPRCAAVVHAKKTKPTIAVMTKDSRWAML